MRLSRAGIASGALLACIGSVQAHELQSVRVEGQSAAQPPPVAASEGRVSGDELSTRPILRTGEIMETVPGMIATQHSGSGKANQYFLRGFNLDHGTDFNTSVDGMPVNMPTHGHGQGYTDINFLIPEMVDDIYYRKGPYYAGVGDFSGAGSADISTRLYLDRQRIKFTGGGDDYYRALFYGGKDLGQDRNLAYAVETQTYNGPWKDISEDVEKYNGLLSYGWRARDTRYVTTLMAYRNQWNSADQIPRRAVRSGLIDDLGSLDQDAGGESHRYSLSLSWDNPRQQGTLYAIDYGLNLWSDFTYFLDDPVDGDEFEQLDERQVYGGKVAFNNDLTLGGIDFTSVWGVQLRHDNIGDVGLFNSAGRDRLATVRRDQVRETAAGVFGSLSFFPLCDVRATLGLRYDHYYFDVDDKVGVNGNGVDLSPNSGHADDGIVSPKLSLAWLVSERMEYYLSTGYGFHSNDARGTTIRVNPDDGSAADKVDPLVRSRGEELGARFYPGDDLEVSLALWQLRLDSELLFVGDAGNTEAGRPSLRRGVELNVFYRPSRQLSLDLELAATRARYRDSVAGEGDYVEGAPNRVIGAGIHYHAEHWFAGYRLRHLGPRPLDSASDQESGSTTIQNVKVGLRNRNWELALELLNLTDADDHDIDYFYASRLQGEAAGGVEDIHYHPILPRTWRLSVERAF
ncbi:TonB-dependent receptor [Alcanivorax sp. N3-2A]|nr:TonB-dependent receptor [Alcanivorax sp. N3-2A]|tara:strand:+ start:9500 stop:11557 length:2058 start_codon:yes stop_codon:yes gene_type:complete